MGLGVWLKSTRSIAADSISKQQTGLRSPKKREIVVEFNKLGGEIRVANYGVQD